MGNLLRTVKFQGTVELEDADDRGTYDIWLVRAIQKAIETGPEIDDVYQKINLSWEID